MKRKIAAILAADAAEYSRLVAEDEEAALRQLVICVAIFRERIEAHGGRVFNTAGDAVLAEFQSAVEAVRSAIAIQNALLDHNRSMAPAKRMMFRMGLSIGDVVDHEGDLLGDGVNIAARLQTLAEPGGIAISKWVQEQVAGKVPLDFRDAGRQQVRNIPAPVHVYKACIARAPAAEPADPRAGMAPRRRFGWRAGAVAGTVAALLAVVAALTLTRPEASAVVIRAFVPFMWENAANAPEAPSWDTQQRPAETSPVPSLARREEPAIIERPAVIPSAAPPGGLPPAVSVPLGLDSPAASAPRDPIGAALRREPPEASQERLKEAALPPSTPTPDAATSPAPRSAPEQVALPSAAPAPDTATSPAPQGPPEQAALPQSAPAPDAATSPAPQGPPEQAALPQSAPAPDAATSPAPQGPPQQAALPGAAPVTDAVPTFPILAPLTAPAQTAPPPPAATARPDAAGDRKRQKVRCAEIMERAQLGDLTSDDQAFLRGKCR